MDFTALISARLSVESEILRCSIFLPCAGRLRFRYRIFSPVTNKLRMRPPNKSGGGANTNLNGLKFERDTDLRKAFDAHPRYRLDGDNIIDLNTDIIVGVLFKGRGLYKNLLEKHGVKWSEIISKQLLPDGAVVVGGTLFIIEKKYQAGSGSVDEKLQTCHFKKRQYERLVEKLDLRVQFYYLLADWFDKDKYKDVQRYIEEVGCRYFFKEIPLEALGL